MAARIPGVAETQVFPEALRPAAPWDAAIERAVDAPAVRHYFRFALASWVVGAWLLVPEGAVLAGFHALVLGFATTVALVASSQLIAVVQAPGAERPGAALARFWLHAGAVASLVAGFALRKWLLVSLGGLLFFGSLSAFLAMQARALRSAAPAALRVAFHAGWGSLAMAALLGVVAALGHHFDLGLAQLPLFMAHAGGGLAGWFLILTLGIFYYLMPYFALAPQRLALRASGTLALGGTGAILAFVTPFVGGWGPTVAFALILAAGAKYLWDTQGVFYIPRRYRWEPLWLHVAASQVWLAVALGLGVVAALDSLVGSAGLVRQLTGQGGTAWRMGTAAAWAATAGFVLNAATGYLHKIVPCFARAAKDGRTMAGGDAPAGNRTPPGYWPYNGGVLLVTIGLLRGSDFPTAGLAITALGASLVAIDLFLAERMEEVAPARAVGSEGQAGR